LKPVRTPRRAHAQRLALRGRGNGPFSWDENNVATPNFSQSLTPWSTKECTATGVFVIAFRGGGSTSANITTDGGQVARLFQACLADPAPFPD
jgi:hypothetical protein